MYIGFAHACVRDVASPEAVKNRLLQLVPEGEREAVQEQLVSVPLPRFKELYKNHQSIDAVYFPVNSVVSIIVEVGEKEHIEIGTVGNEGLVGAFAMLRPDCPIGTNVVQVPGEALRLDVNNFHHWLTSSERFSRLIRKYIFAFTRQVMLAGACNRLHTMEERCARWLLMTHDRAGSDTFGLTQEFLSEMLGVRRATVNVAIGMLKTAGFITYVRGQITVVNRIGLESAACACYDLIRKEYASVELGSN